MGNGSLVWIWIDREQVGTEEGVRSEFETAEPEGLSAAVSHAHPPHIGRVVDERDDGQSAPVHDDQGDTRQGDVAERPAGYVRGQEHKPPGDVHEENERPHQYQIHRPGFGFYVVFLVRENVNSHHEKSDDKKH